MTIAYTVALLEDRGHRREQILGYTRKYICQILNWPRDDKGGLVPPPAAPEATDGQG